MYQPQQNQAKLPTGLAALVALQRSAAATTPDGAPTIASQLADKARAEMQPQGQPQDQGQAPQGIAGIAPNLPPQAQNAAIGAQIKQGEEEKAKQAMMQMAQQQAAQQGQGQGAVFARGGIAGLPADNMHNMGRYARGGVLGFAGDKPEGSKVERTFDENTDKDTVGEIDPNSIQKLFSRIGSALKGSFTEAVNEQSGISTPVEKLTPQQIETLAGIIPQETREKLTPQQIEGKMVNVPPAPAPAPAPLNKGLGNLVRTAAVAKPSAAAVVKPAAGAPQSQTAKVPDAITAPNIPTLDETELVKLLNESKKLRAERTDFEGENIRGIEAAEAKRKALEASRVGSSAIDRLIAFTANAGYRPGGGGSRVAAYDEKQQQLAQMNLQAETLAAANVRAQKELAYNVKIGDNAAAMQSQKELSALRQKQSEIGVHAAGQQYVAQMQARSDELRQMGEDRRNAATNAAHLKAAAMGQEGQRRIAALATQIARNAGRPEDAFDYVSAVEYIERAKAGPKIDIASQAQALKEQALYEKGKGIADKYNNPTEYERRMRDFAIRAGGSAGGAESAGGGGGGGGSGGFTYVGPAGGK
jgi:hypothetical protein